MSAAMAPAPEAPALQRLLCASRALRRAAAAASATSAAPPCWPLVALALAALLAEAWLARR